MRLTKYRDREKDRQQVDVARSILKTPVDIVCDLPANVRVSFSGPLIDDSQRGEFESRGWVVTYDEYRNVSTIFIPKMASVDRTKWFSLLTWSALASTIWWAVWSAVQYMHMTKIIS